MSSGVEELGSWLVKSTENCQDRERSDAGTLRGDRGSESNTEQDL
jgi:hypothetical protein